MIAEGIDCSQEASPKDLSKIKDALLHVVEDRKLTPSEVTKAHAICDFMILDSMEDCLILWFGKSQETDDKIWSDFSEDVTMASMGLFEHWSYAVEEPRMIVALVILLDQFRRNMFRGTKGMYSCDKMCAGYVKRAMAAGIDKKLKPKEMIFLLLNLTHSEELEDQHLCFDEYCKLEQTLDRDDPLRVFRDILSVTSTLSRSTIGSRTGMTYTNVNRLPRRRSSSATDRSGSICPFASPPTEDLRSSAMGRFCGRSPSRGTARGPARKCFGWSWRRSRRATGISTATPPATTETSEFRNRNSSTTTPTHTPWPSSSRSSCASGTRRPTSRPSPLRG